MHNCNLVGIRGNLLCHKQFLKADMFSRFSLYCISVLSVSVGAYFWQILSPSCFWIVINSPDVDNRNYLDAYTRLIAVIMSLIHDLMAMSLTTPYTVIFRISFGGEHGSWSNTKLYWNKVCF